MKNPILPLLCMFCLFLLGCDEGTATNAEAETIAGDAGYQVGDTATDFKLKNVDGKMVSMADYKDAKGFIVTFTCNTCPFSKAYEDRIIALHKKYAPKGYPVVAINPNDVKESRKDSYEHMQERAKEKNFPFPYLHDETQEIAKAYGATRTPHLYIVQKQQDGQFKVAYIGAIDDNSRDAQEVQKKYAETALGELLANKPVSQASTKAIGCTIKWRES
ncbi:thioredoxin family protein [Pontibacter cellulosilyticus]|uniref:Thioredoxin family protein n=1 Tax=Pontibacter cellulosilyticus TaxID=1720253 RepID=A0A923SL32_9BACT|nr:thioredoxin family protein [Pontibacter cellulosilyticus]MBC5994436.1 thioredoxin family protein [Pontibacter cellulosilyticus]